jgi:hypothetical protein
MKIFIMKTFIMKTRNVKVTVNLLFILFLFCSKTVCAQTPLAGTEDDPAPDRGFHLESIYQVMDEAGKHKVGIWVEDNHPSNRNKAAFSIKFATESQTVTHWTDAAGTRTVNIIGKIEL